MQRFCNKAQSISNSFLSFFCHNSNGQQISQSVEFCWSIIEENMRWVNTELSLHFRMANTEPSMDFRRANTEPPVHFRRANTEINLFEIECKPK